MNPPPVPALDRPSAKRALFWIGLTVLFPFVALGLMALGVASYFHLGSDTRALRNGLMEASGVEWRQQLGLNIGSMTWGAVRAGLSFVPLDPEARAAVQAVRGAEVGIYELASETKRPDGADMLAVADRVLNERGWERVVGVLDGEILVGVYVPAKTVSARRMKCCVMVFDGRRMVVVRASANLEPLLRCLRNRLDLGSPIFPQLAGTS
jgi:hypothetical protein